MTIAQGTKVLGATPTFQGGTKTLTLNLKPGTYVFYCSVPGHRAAGMEGKLTVQMTHAPDGVSLRRTCHARSGALQDQRTEGAVRWM